MKPMTYREWCCETDRDVASTPAHLQDYADPRQAYDEYRAGMAFIQSQIGGVPVSHSDRVVEFIT